jgi:hypothetical protein
MTCTSLFAATFMMLAPVQPGSQASLVVARPAELRQEVTEQREFVGTVMPLEGR